MMVFSRALVTGGAGFIGSHLTEALLRRGCSVAIVDNFDDFYPRTQKEANLAAVSHVGETRLYATDIRDFEALRAVFEKERPEIVFHLAARAGVRPSIEQPRLYADVNIAGTLNLLLLAQSWRVRKFVFGSSSSVYGASARVPFEENQEGLKPISPYAATKLAGELLCHTYSYLYGLPTVCLRFFTVYGPRQRPDLAIHKFAALIEQGKPIPVFGDGSTGRDYTYIEDIVEGVLAAASLDATYDVFNLGNSRPVKLLQMISLLEAATGKRATLEFLPPQPGDVPITWAEISKARRCLGFEPRTPLELGLQKFVAWYRQG
jgi:UDP-glucuronate 4-epimerase